MLGDTPEEIVTYEGRVRVSPSDMDTAGYVSLIGTGEYLSDYLIEKLEVPEEDGIPNEGSFLARITVEVFPDPDMTNWPNT